MDNYGEHLGQGRTRNSQARRDAVTVEIGYALCSALFLAAVAFGVVAGPAWVFGLSDTARGTLVASGATLGAVLFMARVVSVLNRFAHETDGQQQTTTAAAAAAAAAADDSNGRRQIAPDDSGLQRTTASSNDGPAKASQPSQPGRTKPDS